MQQTCARGTPHFSLHFVTCAREASHYFTFFCCEIHIYFTGISHFCLPEFHIFFTGISHFVANKSVFFVGLILLAWQGNCFGGWPGWPLWPGRPGLEYVGLGGAGLLPAEVVPRATRWGPSRPAAAQRHPGQRNPGQAYPAQGASLVKPKTIPLPG